MSSDADDFGGAEHVEGVNSGNSDVDFGGLAVGVSGGDALTEGFQASHLGLCPAPGIIAAPPLPSCAAFLATSSATRALNAPSWFLRFDMS